MKQKYLLTLFALFLCLTICFAGCANKGNETPPDTNPIPSGDNQPGEPEEDPVADRNAILTFLNKTGEDEGGDITPAIPESPFDILNLMTLQVHDFKTEGINFNSLLLQGGKGLLTMHGINIYFQVGTNGDILMVTQTGTDTYNTQIISLDNFPVSMPEIPEFSTGDSNLSLPELTVDHLQPEGNGLYRISKDYFSDLIDVAVSGILKNYGMKASEISAVKAILKDYVERMNIRIAFEVKKGTVTALEFNIAADHELIAELMEMIGMNISGEPSRKFHLNLDLRAELAEDAATPFTLSLDFLIPAGGTGTIPEIPGTGVLPFDSYTSDTEYLKADFDLKVYNPGANAAAGAKMLECTLNAEQGIGAEKNEMTFSLAINVAENIALNVAAEYFNVVAEYNSNGNKTTVTFKIAMDPTVAVTFPAAVEAYAKTFNEQFEPNKALMEYELAVRLADTEHIQNAYLSGLPFESYYFSQYGVYANVYHTSQTEQDENGSPVNVIKTEFKGYSLNPPENAEIIQI